MKLDNLLKPKPLWFEDEDGNKFTQTEWDDVAKDSSKVWQQHISEPVVKHSVYQEYRKGKWPVRFLKWVINKMPYSWESRGPLLYSGSASIGCDYPIVKYLVEQKGWKFSQACSASSQLCERCLNICLDELSGTSQALCSNTTCDSCQYIDPEYLEKHRVWCCYRTFLLGGDVARAWEEKSVNTPWGFWVPEPPEPNSFLKVWNRVKLFGFSRGNEETT